jgi:hypothetical protein
MEILATCGYIGVSVHSRRSATEKHTIPVSKLGGRSHPSRCFELSMPERKKRTGRERRRGIDES